MCCAVDCVILEEAARQFYSQCQGQSSVLSTQSSILRCQQSPRTSANSRLASLCPFCQCQDTVLNCTVQYRAVKLDTTALLLHTTVMDMSKTPLTLRVDYKSQASLDPRALRNRDLLRATGS